MIREIKPIRNDEDHAATLAAIEGLWEAAPGTPEHDCLEVLAMLVDDYERRRCPIEPADAVELIRCVMEQRGSTRKDLEAALGSRARLGDPEPPPPAHHENGLASARGLRHPGRRPDQAVRIRPLSAPESGSN
jgi:antitoxin component HigA of HigAB toxin-antitoxin module